MALPVQPANTSSSHKGRHVLSCRLRSQTAGFASGEGASLRHSADHHLQVSQGFMNIVQIVSEKTMSCRFRVLWRLGQAVHFLAPNGVGAQQPCLVMCVQDAGKEGPGPDSTNPGQTVQRNTRGVAAADHACCSACAGRGQGGTGARQHKPRPEGAAANGRGRQPQSRQGAYAALLRVKSLLTQTFPPSNRVLKALDGPSSLSQLTTCR